MAKKSTSSYAKGLRLHNLLKHNVLKKSFYSRSTLQVAKELLGKIIISRTDPRFSLEDPRAKVVAGRIVETEAYCADDPACHAARGRTPRSLPLFEEPGKAYVYFIYGMYEMLNFVTEPNGHPGAVLIRAIEPVHGFDLIAERRRGVKKNVWTSGPGRLARALGIQMNHNRDSLEGPRLFVVNDDYLPEQILCSPRVGISEGTEMLWRYFIADHSFVSKVRENRQAKKG